MSKEMLLDFVNHRRKMGGGKRKRMVEVMDNKYKSSLFEMC